MTATFRVLDQDGPGGLTTTRVAEVAGVSVGTLYQYFPNKQALIGALLSTHLQIAIDEVRRVAAEVAGEPLDVQVDRIVRGFVAIKAARAPISRAMQPAITGPDGIDERPLVRAATESAALIVARLLAGGAEPSDAEVRRASVLCSAMEGIIATAIAKDPDRLSDPEFVDQLVALARAALATARSTP